jgi:hypothetical protein
MKIFSTVCLLIILSSCSKHELKCEAKNSQGDVMYEVSGTDVCEDQISTENEEYCDC